MHCILHETIKTLRDCEGMKEREEVCAVGLGFELDTAQVTWISTILTTICHTDRHK